MGYTPPQLFVNKVAGGWAIYPPNATTTDDLFIYANTTDAYPIVSLLGAGGIILSLPANGVVQLKDTTDNLISIGRSGADIVFTGNYANKNISFVPNGTGLVKFGTSVGTGDVVCNGYVTILDNAGGTCKLMRCA